MHWTYLILAICLEVSGTISMKLSYGLTRILPTGLMFVFYALSFVFMSLAIKRLEISYAYAVWSAVGTAAIAVIGVVWFGENLSAQKTISLLLIIVGVVGLHLTEALR
jgi:small multidrug resistance pump